MEKPRQRPGGRAKATRAARWWIVALSAAWAGAASCLGEPLAPRLEAVAVCDEFDSAAAWEAHPDWLTGASAGAEVAVANGVACFRVPEGDRAMKWSRSLAGVSLADMPYLALRYRAENLVPEGEDYFVYLDDGGPAQCHALRLKDLVSDGQWHLVAVDARRFAAKPEIDAVAVQVRAGHQGKGGLWLDWLMFADRLPDGAVELRPAERPDSRPDWEVPLALAEWVPQSSWLSHPCAKPESGRKEKSRFFRVNEPGRGMKWSWNLPKAEALAGHRFLTFHYKATNCRSAGDYLLGLLGKMRDGKADYLPALPSAEVIADGRWHLRSLQLGGLQEQMNEVTGLALQVQAGSATPAELEVDRIALTDKAPLIQLDEYLDVAGDGDFAGYSPVTLGKLFNQDSAPWSRRLRLGEVLPGGRHAVAGIPFELAANKPDLYGSSLDGREELGIPLHGKGSEVFLLAWAVFSGPEEPSRGSGRLQRIADVDRLRLVLEYADGSASECLPWNVGTHRFEISEGPQVLCVCADPGKQLSRMVIRDLTEQGAFGVAAISVHAEPGRRFPECAEEMGPLRIAPARSALNDQQTPRVRVEGNVVALANAHVEIRVQVDPNPKALSLTNRTTGHDCLAGRDCVPLLELSQGTLTLAGDPRLSESEGRAMAEIHYRTGDDVMATLRIDLGGGREVGFDLQIANAGKQAALLGFRGPNFGSFCVGSDLAQNYYLMPRRGAVFHHRDANFDERYCGHGMPLQFISVVNPAAGEGLYLRTEDTSDVWRNYQLAKDRKGVRFGVEYPVGPLPAGEIRKAVRTVVGVSGGNWGEGFEAYRNWVETWCRPAAARQPWFREVFNFRQRFLWSHDPLCDRETGRFQLERALTEAEEQFGGIEYLHLFDWGYSGKYGRIYGRTGDYPIADHLPGGMDAFRRAIGSVQAQGVPVGLYIEGYLLDERGKLGSSQGKDWQIIGKDGNPLFWPKSTEMFMCPFVPAWREVQASTYATRVAELGVNGMYVDQFGFANSSKDCFSAAHGHPVPGYTVVGERDCMRQIRERVDAAAKGVVLYGEECPCDVNSQYQDGSFTYAMAESARTETLVPLNLLRFALPTFKTFEILVCDKPTGTWATGVKWTFFNGEGLWLEGPAREWFAPQTLAAIRKCHAILREHRDAFASQAPRPLIPTEAGGVYANLFPAGAKQVVTLYNARHRSFEGEVLRFPHVEGMRFVDAWNNRPLTPRRDGPDDVVASSIEPLGVGCLVVEPQAR